MGKKWQWPDETPDTWLLSESLSPQTNGWNDQMLHYSFEEYQKVYHLRSRYLKWPTETTPTWERPKNPSSQTSGWND